MKYLKISHKYIIPIFILFVSACVSDTLTVKNDTDTDENDSLNKEITLGAKDYIDSSVDLETPVEEIDIPAYSLDWTVPDSNKSPLTIILPEIAVIDKKSIDSKISDHQYISGFAHNNYRGAGYVYDDNNVIDKASINRQATDINPVEQTTEEQQTKTVPININPDFGEDINTPDTVVSERNVSAPILDKLDIFLDGFGWIYLPDKDNESVEYIGRKFTDKSTIYVFIPKLEGNYKLNFQYQDLSTDNYIVEKINLKVYENPNDPVDDNLTDNSEIIVETENLVIDDDIDVSAVQMLQNGNCEGLSSIVSEILESNNTKVKNILPEIAECLYNSSYYVEAIQVLEYMIQYGKSQWPVDYLLYRLGNLYEKDSTLRNEMISAEYYKKLVDNFPASIYWDESQDRYRYLKRRYIDIR